MGAWSRICRYTFFAWHFAAMGDDSWDQVADDLAGVGLQGVGDTAPSGDAAAIVDGWADLDAEFLDVSEAQEPQAVQLHALPALPAGKRPRGRPVGTGGSHEFRRAMRAEEVAIAEQQLAIPADTPEMTYLEKNRALSDQIRASRRLEKEQAAEATLVKFGPSIGNIGTDIQRRLFQATLGSPPDGPVCPVVERCLLNLDERPYSSAAAESNTLGIPANTFARKVILCGSGLLESSSLLWGSFCATLADRIVMKGWEPLLFVKEARYDETPSKIRVQDKSKSITSVTGAVGQSTSELNRETKTAKVLQSEIHIGALVKDPVSEEYMFFLGRVPTCLQCLERTTSEATLAALKDLYKSVPELTRASDLFGMKLQTLGLP
jgi:hypothetical protein